MNESIKQLAEALIPEGFKKAKFFTLMLFFRGYEIDLPNGDTWINVRNISYPSYQAALDAYTSIPCPASQLIEAETEEELKTKMNQMKVNFQDHKWLEENLYPYL